MKKIIKVSTLLLLLLLLTVSVMAFSHTSPEMFEVPPIPEEMMLHLTFQLPNGAAPALMDIVKDESLLIVLLRLELLIPGAQASDLRLFRAGTPIPTADTTVQLGNVFHKKDTITVQVKKP